MSLHIALREQISTNRPNGIAKIYKTILQKNDIHKTEHIMMNILAETLWESQRSNTPPDEEKYFEKLKKII